MCQCVFFFKRVVFFLSRTYNKITNFLTYQKRQKINPKMATISLHSGKNNLDCNNKKNSSIQSVPFKIQADCDANVNRYFNNYIKTDENGQTKASFRGYPLRGKTVELPEGYVGLVLHEGLRPETEKSERKFYVTNHFLKIQHWNWDKAPSDNDSITQVLQWVNIAEALHSPILEE